MRRTLLLILLPWVVHAASAPASLAVEPSALSFGCVNVITGDYCEARDDYTVNCFEPIPIRRIHVSSDQNGDVGGIWRSCGEQVCIVQGEGGLILYLEEAGGGVVKFNWNTYQPDLGRSYCNTGAGEISGRTNLNNYRLSINGLKAILTTGSGEKRIYRHLIDDPQMAYDLSRHQLRAGARWAISEVVRPNGNRIRYEYDESRVEESGIVRHRMKQTAVNHNGTVEFGWAEYDYKSVDVNYCLTVRTSEDRSIYRYVTAQGTTGGGNRPGTLLRDVTFADGVRENYTYDTRWDDVRRPFLLAGRSRPDGRRRGIEYYRRMNQWVGNCRHWTEKTDPMSGWVYCLKSSIGPSGEMKPIAWFDYGFEPIERRRLRRLGWTDVHDATGGCVRYHYDDCDRLTMISRRGSPDVSVERFVWEDGRLAARSVSDGEGRVLVALTYLYDDRGNVLEETLWGELTGTSDVALLLDDGGTPMDNGVERHTIYRSYSDDGFNLLLSETDGPTATRYAYRSNTDLLTCKMVFEDGVLRERHFFAHNTDASIHRSIHDNGTGDDPQDLTGVTERKIVDYTYRPEKPGLPLEKTESYWDKAAAALLVYRREVTTYNCQNLLHSTYDYGSGSGAAHTAAFLYDDVGRLVKSIDPLDQTAVHTYDKNGNLVALQRAQSGYVTINHYDCANRLVESQRLGLDGSNYSKSYAYDALDRKVREEDSCGRATEFVLDSYGRCLCERLPVARTEGGWLRPEIRRQYDSLDRVTAETDPKGYTTRTEYNVRGQLVGRRYPDGTSERFEYTLDGRQVVKVERNGTRVETIRDYLDRITIQRRIAPDGNLLTEEHTIYDGSRKILEIDPEGIETHFAYNAFGQLIETKRGDTRITWEYDPFGRKSREFRWLSPSEFCATRWIYDALDRVTSEREEDSQGRVLSRTDFEYDGDGNKRAVLRYIQGDEIATTRRTYDILGRVIDKVDPMGAKTLTIYDHQYLHEGEPVLAKTVTDPLGRETRTLCDAQMRPIQKTIFSAGVVVSQTDLFYDLSGNKTKESHAIIVNGQIDRNFDLRWCYGPTNRLEWVTEGSGGAEERTTTFAYDGFGQLEHTTRPDGTSINRSYDALGRVLTYSGPRFAYCYTYDCNSNVVEVDSSEGNLYRTYDVNNQMVQETLPTGYTLTYTYDPLNRVTQLVLPDGSAVDYAYDEAYLRSIRRRDSLHTFDSYDLQGRPLVETTSAGQRRVRDYDLLGRTLSNHYPTYRETEFAYDQVGNLTEYIQDDTLCCYAYDALYQLAVEPSHTYSYDSMYNRVDKNGVEQTVDDLNQVLDDGACVFKYDANGNLIERAGQTFQYDALGRLIEVVTSENRITFTYDAFDRRLSKTSNGETIHYLYDNQREIGTMDADAQLVEFRVLVASSESEIGATVLVELLGKTYIPVHDFRGSIVGLTDLTGIPIETYTYTAFGEVDQPSILKNPWRFLSKREETETSLIYFGRRYYDPSLGRWITPDPAGYAEGPNLYAYCLNQPLTSIDPWGLVCHRCVGRRVKESIRDFGQAVGDFIMRMVDPERSFFTGNWGNDGPAYSVITQPDLPCVSHRGYIVMNGILTSREGAADFAQSIADRTGVGNLGIHNRSYGVFGDIVRASLVWMGVEHPAVNKCVEKMREELARVGSHGIVELHGHSEAVMVYRQALNKFTPDQQARFYVSAYGGPKRIRTSNAGKVVNYVAPGDPVARLGGSFMRPQSDCEIVFEPNVTSRISIENHIIFGGPYENAIARTPPAGFWLEEEEAA